MGRKAKPTMPEIARRLMAIKLQVSAMKDAMPTVARDLRRSVCEGIDDLIEDVSR